MSSLTRPRLLASAGVGSAVFAVPPGARPGGYVVGETLLG